MLDVRFILCYLSTITDNTSVFFFFWGGGGWWGVRGKGLPHQCVSLERNDKLVDIKSTSKIIWEIT